MGQLSLDALRRRVAECHIPVCIDSRKVQADCVFVAEPGSTEDGAAFIPAAVAAGAGYIVCEPRHVAACSGAIAVPCDNPRLAAARLAADLHDTDHLPFPLIGVTGTNGKTTVTYLLEHLFTSAGRKTGVLGTVAYRWPGHDSPAAMTTPDSLELHAMLEAMGKTGVQIAFMEVSSHALDQQRVACIPFTGAVFTNLTQDHLDYHGTLEKYFAAKARLFLELPLQEKFMAVGTDGEWGRRLLASLPETARAVGYGLRPGSGARPYVEGRILSSSAAGVRLAVRFEGQEWETASPLIGAYNAENLLAVEALGLGMGLEPESFRCLEDFCGVPGRLERIRNPQQLNIFVDYAHTPDALVNMLTAVRGVGFKRILCVFGCGGDRDRTKRPLMGQAVASLADVAILTSDNPRHEDPEAIMEDVRPGLVGAREIIIEADRREAIRRAIELLRPEDALVVAGKGHERTQQIGDVKYPYSDQQTIREILGCA